MRRSLLLLLSLGCATAAFGQLGEVALSFGRAKASSNSVGTLDQTGGAEAKLDTGFRLGFRFTINSRRFFGHEIGYAYTRSVLKIPDYGDVSMPVHQGMYNFLAYATPEGSKVRPFGTVGGQFSTFYPPGTGVFEGNGMTKFGFNYGGGVKVKVSSMFLVRLDVRDYVNAKPEILYNPSGMMHMLEISAGLGFTF